MKKLSWRILLTLVMAGAILAACGPATPAATQAPEATEAPTTEAPEPTEAETEAPAAECPPNITAAGQELADACAGKMAGTTVSMSGPFTDQDAVLFDESVKEFEAATGIDIQYSGSKEFEASIRIAVEGNNAPDIADFPQPGLLASLVSTGAVKDLNGVVNEDTLKKNYLQSWLDMSVMEGPDGPITAGVWNRNSVKSLVWYPKDQFDAAGYTVPQTWDELTALTEQIAADGDTPWCIGIESGAATGWPMTDWVEDVMLRTTSLENYDAWVKGELPFDSPEVRTALGDITDIWFNDAYVYGGRAAITTTAFGDSPKAMFENPPKCWLHRQANFITSFFPTGLEAGVNYDAFYLPPIDEQYGRPVLVAGDLYAMFNDRPEVRAVIQFFSSGESVKAWIQAGATLAPQNDVSLDWYTDPVTKNVASILKNATAVRFDGSDMMPGAVGAGSFWKEMTDFVSGSTDLDTALKNIDASWPK
jgi:alpha-glucoside transport system substrate-binding protein